MTFPVHMTISADARNDLEQSRVLLARLSRGSRADRHVAGSGPGAVNSKRIHCDDCARSSLSFDRAERCSLPECGHGASDDRRAERCRALGHRALRKQAIPFMAFSFPVRSGYLAHHPRNQPRSEQGGLFDLHGGAIIFADSGFHSRPLHAPAAPTEARPLSIVAALLRPFAGERAEQISFRLLESFGSLDRALTATDEQMLKACADDPDIGGLVLAARNLVHAAMRESVTRSEVRSDDPALLKYLILKMRGKGHEELHAIFVDRDLGFIREELIAVGGYQAVESRMRPLLTRALELEADGFYLVHNHPSRCPRPSSEDVRSTLAISQVARALDLTVFDHLIIAGNSVASMRGLGLL